MSNPSKDKKYSEHKCGECAKFKVPGTNCPNYEHFFEFVDGRPMMDGECTACSEFLERGAYELGDYVFKVKRDLLLVYEGSKPRYPVNLSGLSSLQNRKALAKSLGLEEDDVHRLAAKILGDIEQSIDKKTRQEEAKPATPSGISKSALQILETTDPIEYIANIIQVIHYGDREKSKVIWLATLTPGLGHELNLIIVGITGVGKSDLDYAVLSTVPDEYVCRLKECSPKAVYYAVNAGMNLDKCTLYFDDVPDNPETVKLLKDITSENRTDPRLWTVTKEREHLDIELKGNFAVLASAIKNLSDEGDQIVRRFLVLNPDEKPEVNVQILEKIKGDMRLGRGKRWLPQEFEVAKEVTRQIKEADYEVHVPFDFEFPDYGTVARSELKQFIALIWAVAKARFKQRLTEGKILFAEPADFETAAKLWSERQPWKIAENAVTILKELSEEEPQLVYDGDEKVAVYSPEPVTSTTLARKLKEKPRALRDTLDHLFNMGFADRKAIGGRGNPYAYWKGPVCIQNGKEPNDFGDPQTPKSLSPIRLKNLENSVNDYYAQIKTQYPQLDMEKVHEKYMGRISLLIPGFRRNNHKPESSPVCQKEPNDLGESETPRSPVSFSEPSKSLSDVNDHFSVNNKDRSEFNLNSSVTEENVLGWLRLDWKGGTEQEFDKLLMTQGYTAEQAVRLREKWLNQGLFRTHSGILFWADGDQQLSVKKVLEKVHGVFVEDTQEQFQRSAIQIGNLTETEAESLFTQLVDNGKLGMTPEGLWKWC